MPARKHQLTDTGVHLGCMYAHSALRAHSHFNIPRHMWACAHINGAISGGKNTLNSEIQTTVETKIISALGSTLQLEFANEKLGFFCKIMQCNTHGELRRIVKRWEQTAGS